MYSNILNTIAELANRFKEPSSWAGIGGLLALVGLHLDPGLQAGIMFIGAGLSCVLAFLIPEKKK